MDDDDDDDEDDDEDGDCAHQFEETVSVQQVSGD